jgi:hypothetical protein
MTILEEHGLFWWHDQIVPDHHFAPDTAIGGLLKIDDDGRIILELHGVFPNEHGPLGVMVGPRQYDDKQIQGVLKQSNKRVLLIGLFVNGGRYSSKGISYQQFFVKDCLIGDHSIPRENTKLKFVSLEVKLNGFEEWLRLGSISISRATDTLSTGYTKPESHKYKICDGILSITFGLAGKISVLAQTDTVSFKEEASIFFKPNISFDLAGMREQYQSISDLLIVLTGSSYRLSWPSVSLDEHSSYQWYFVKFGDLESNQAPRIQDCWTNFVQLRNNFSEICSTWKEKRQKFGPAFYLYLGTKRGISLYAENRFVNIIWGIETFHRTKMPTSPPQTWHDKINRIADQVLDEADRKWLLGKLKYSYEPTLAERIYDIFIELPIGLDPSRLRTFATACAAMRNVISHFGGRKYSDEYGDFVKDIEKKSDALSTLYHCLLLHEIGVDSAVLNWWVYEGFRAYPIRASFVEVGLFDESMLKIAETKSNEIAISAW